jgi:tetrahydromethanopterin S-methyltransferase subunit B
VDLREQVNELQNLVKELEQQLTEARGARGLPNREGKNFSISERRA